MRVTFIRPLASDDREIGGKARSLARLSALGLRTPAGFAISAAFARAMKVGGPLPPTQLRSVGDVAALDAARAALVAAPLPDEFQRALDAALLTLAPAGEPDATFAVRSSAPNEDDATHAAPGIFDSKVRIRRADVAHAVKEVLASALSPAAWSYAPRSAAPSTELAVLVHRFIEGTAQGAAARESSTPGSAGDVVIDAHVGLATATALAQIRDAVARASSRFGSVELEWVAEGDQVTFLQLRPFHSTRAATGSADQPVMSTANGPHGGLDDWTWDAAHNPTPLSPAQAGLVALVDECCPTGVRQEVRGGYLFVSRAGARPAADERPEARAAFEFLTADVDARLNALGEAFGLEPALEVYLAAYTPLFGLVQPACAAARAALRAFVAREVPDARETGERLMAGVVSVATVRADLARAIADAPEPARRQAAIDAYLRAFGDESPRWDVAEATFREAPERLLFLGAEDQRVRPAPLVPASDGASRDAIAARLPDVKRAAFLSLLASAREAAAVSEDDDHLFARLQAAVRRALLVLGRNLLETGRLRAVDDVFYLPLQLARALDAPRLARALVPDQAATLETLDLSAVATEGRRAFAAASAAPPPLPLLRNTVGGVIAGLSGSAGRAIGRAVHHPASVPLTANTILIAVTLLPTELPLLAPAALIVETGTTLGHVAAQARERGIPAVVAAHGACAAIREGQLVIVDGTRGQITLVD